MLRRIAEATSSDAIVGVPAKRAIVRALGATAALDADASRLRRINLTTRTRQPESFVAES